MAIVLVTLPRRSPQLTHLKLRSQQLCCVCTQPQKGCKAGASDQLHSLLCSSRPASYHHAVTSRPPVQAWLKSHLSTDLSWCHQLYSHCMWCDPSCSTITFTLVRIYLCAYLSLLLDYKQVESIKISDESLHFSYFQVQQVSNKCLFNRKRHFPKTIISNQGIPIKTTVLWFIRL